MTYMLSEFYFFISKQNKNKKLIKIQLLKFLLRSYEIIQFFYLSQVENIHHYEFSFFNFVIFSLLSPTPSPIRLIFLNI